MHVCFFAEQPTACDGSVTLFTQDILSHWFAVKYVND